MKTKAKYKQRPLEKIQQQQVQERIANLEKALAKSEYEKAHLQDELRIIKENNDYYRAQWKESGTDQGRYKFLRSLELMVLGKEGAQYLKEDTLDEYCDTQLKALHENLYGSYGSTINASAMAHFNMRMNDAYRKAIAKQNPGIALQTISHPRSKK